MLKRLLRTDLLSLLATGVVQQALTFLSGPLVARLLGPSGRGEVVVVLACSLLATVLTTASLGLGISQTVARSGVPAWEAVGRHVPRWLAWCTVPGLLTAAGIVFFLGWSTETALLAAVGFTMATLGGFIQVFRAMAMGQQLIRKVNVADIVLVSGYVFGVVTLFLVLRNSDPVPVLSMQIIGQSLSLVMLLRALGRPRRGSASPAADVHRFARATYFSGFGSLDRLGVDQLLLGHLLGTAALGLYAVGSSIAAMPAILLGTINQALLPKMAGRTPVEGARLLRRYMLVAIVICTGLGLLLEIILPPMIRILFGADFVPATNATRILIVANALFGIRLLLISACQAQGRAGRASGTVMAGTLVLIASITIGAQVGGLVGATVGVLIAAVITILPLVAMISWTGTAPRLTATTPEPADILPE